MKVDYVVFDRRRLGRRRRESENVPDPGYPRKRPASSSTSRTQLVTMLTSRFRHPPKWVQPSQMTSRDRHSLPAVLRSSRYSFTYLCDSGNGSTARVQSWRLSMMRSLPLPPLPWRGCWVFPLEIDQVFVAALLTIIGYSINDTVIIFDRNQENISMLAQTMSVIAFFNTAINQHAEPHADHVRHGVACGDRVVHFSVEKVLRGFSFALIIGVIIGTYSSIFIASPLVIDLDAQKKVIEPVKI